MKGIILAGGNGTRLQPLTLIQNKHLLPIYNKPMILYPLETLKSLEIKDILIVSGGEYIGGFTEFLGDGSRFGVNITYRVQEKAGGIAEALSLSKDFSNGEPITVILGDNIFGSKYLSEYSGKIGKENAMVYLSLQEDPSRFGVAVFDNNGTLISIEEKPKTPKSKYAVTGLYIYPPDVFDKILTLKPSNRGELEITDLNNFYIKEGRCNYMLLDSFWSDAGTFDSLLASANWAQQNK
jgi:glucose-1-phosphate thymidylyltransferase